MTKYVVKNNLDSLEKFIEGARFYGQSANNLGSISFYTGVYRGASFTAGTGTLNGISFVGGVAADGFGGTYVLIAPGDFAAGLWIGFEGANINVINSSGTVVTSGSLVGVFPEYGYVQIARAIVAPSAVFPASGSLTLAWDGMAQGQTQIGIEKILSTQSGNLFGINTSAYSLWRGTTQNMNGQKLTLDAINLAIANMYNKGSGKVDLTMYVNPRSWRTLTSNEAALRNYDYSYDPKKAENGFEAIEYVSQNGRVMIKSHPMVKEGRAFALYLPCWSRSGSAEVAMKIPGSPLDIIYVLPGQSGYVFQSFSDQYLFVRKPVANIYFYGINDESVV